MNGATAIATSSKRMNDDGDISDGHADVPFQESSHVLK
jgi:hypothetical protein